MKTKLILRSIALLIAVGALATWLATGANQGWTKTEVAVKTLDPVTEIEGISYQKKFQPGVELLGVAIVGAVALTGASFFFGKTNKK
jgi:cytochrome bd-type quinol oxidase subunit 2